MNDEERSYVRAIPLLKAANAEVDRRLDEALRSLGDPYLVRWTTMPPRIKSLKSLKRKAADFAWTLTEALEKADDVVGHRVVCNNLQDVERAAAILEESLRVEGITVERKDYTREPRESGYRALHLIIRLPIQIAALKLTVGCEVQIRTLLQNSWAELSRADLYETPVDKDLKEEMKALSDLLAQADDTADRIRQRISRPRQGQPPAEGAPLAESSIAFLFRQAFGIDPPDYLVVAAAQEVRGAKIRSDGLAGALKDDQLIRQVKNAYQRSMGVEPDSPQLLLWVLRALTRGPRSAISAARRAGRRDRAEVERIYRSEVLAEIPETWRELVALIERPAKDEDITYSIRQWADVLATWHGCLICGTKIVEVDALAEALVAHYGLQGGEAEIARDEIEQALVMSGVEVGSWENSSLCSYHGHVMSQD